MQSLGQIAPAIAVALASRNNPAVGASILQGAAAGTAQRQAREAAQKQQEFENKIKQQQADTATEKAHAALDTDQSKQLDAIPDGASALAYLKSIDPRDTKGLQDEFLDADGSVKQYNPFSKDASRIQMLQKRNEAQDATLRKKLGDQVVDNFWKDTLPYSQDPDGQKRIAALYDKQNNTTDFTDMLGAGTGPSDKGKYYSGRLAIDQQKADELVSKDELATLKAVGDMSGFEQKQAIRNWNAKHPSEQLAVPDGKKVPYYTPGAAEQALIDQRTTAAQLNGEKSAYYPMYIKAVAGKDDSEAFLANQKALVVAPLAQDKINNTAIRGAYDDALIRLGEDRNQNAQTRLNVLMRDTDYQSLNRQDISLRSHMLTLESQLAAAPTTITDPDALSKVQGALKSMIKDVGDKQADVESQLTKMEDATPSVTPAPYSPDAPQENQGSGNAGNSGPPSIPSVTAGLKTPPIPAAAPQQPNNGIPAAQPRSAIGPVLKMIGLPANKDGEPGCADGVCMIAKRVGLPVPQTRNAKQFEQQLPSSGWERVPLSEAGPNDIITTRGTGASGRHVQWSIGGGQVVEADSKADNYSNRLVKGRVPANDTTAQAWRYVGQPGAPRGNYTGGQRESNAAPTYGTAIQTSPGNMVVIPPGGRTDYHAMSNSDLMAAFLRLGQKYITKR